MTVREKWEIFRESLTETVSVSRREFLLTTAAGFLGGMVLGMLFSPRKYTMVGCQNGNSSCNNNENDTENERQTDGKEKCREVKGKEK